MLAPTGMEWMKGPGVLVLMLFLASASVQAQYEFTRAVEIPTTAVKDQEKTAACWSHATCSFLESEILRTRGERIDLSERFIIHHVFRDKAAIYIGSKGKTKLGTGGLAHDAIRTVVERGIVPEEAFSRAPGEAPFDHDELASGLKGFLDGLLGYGPGNDAWKGAVERVLDAYLGRCPASFEHGGRRFEPDEFARSLELPWSRYITLCSVTHHPFHDLCVLDLRDNFARASFFNVTLDELVEVCVHAVEKGYGLVWDGDITEEGFQARRGLAILPRNPARKDLFTRPGLELLADQAGRQKAFESRKTADDHLMHLVGLARDGRGTRYFVMKNSWGPIGPHGGKIYMSESYFRMKTVSVLLDPECLPEKWREMWKR